jgi:hypothetical protein
MALLCRLPVHLHISKRFKSAPNPQTIQYYSSHFGTQSVLRFHQPSVNSAECLLMVKHLSTSRSGVWNELPKNQKFGGRELSLWLGTWKDKLAEVLT